MGVRFENVFFVWDGLFLKKGVKNTGRAGLFQGRSVCALSQNLSRGNGGDFIYRKESNDFCEGLKAMNCLSQAKTGKDSSALRNCLLMYQ